MNVQRYKVGYYSDEWGMSSNTPCLVKDDNGYAVKFEDYEQLRQRVAELEKEAKQLRDLQYELMRSGALVAIEKCKNATGQRRVIDMYVSANQIAEDLLNAMDSGA